MGMARSCAFCNRSSMKAARRSHSNIKVLRRQYVNLQKKWIDEKSLLICTRCIKTTKKKAAVAVKASKTKVGL
ncbi:50S ribosomal protein L28 [Candidatus Uhrbacteria bacterium]|nr:50S ribosomal protein L28 [Candidatus Uhrbacteria bacterium]